MESPHSIISTLANAALLQISSAMLNNKTDPEWQFYFNLCLHYFKHLYSRYRVYEDVVQGFLAMAIEQNVMSGSEAREFVDEFKSAGKHHEASECTSGLFTIDFSLALTDRDNAKAHALAQKFEELSLFEELTNGDYIKPQSKAQSNAEALSQNDSKRRAEDD